MRVTPTLALLLIGCLCTVQALQNKDDGVEDYGPDPGPGGDDPKAPKDGKAAAPGGDAGADDPNKVAEPEEEDRTKTKFSDDRFAKLFPSRGGGRSIMPKEIARPKPTLPSFIKGTPATIKAQVVTTPAPRGGARARAIQPVTPRGGGRATPTTSTTPRPGGLRNRAGGVTQRQLSGRLATSAPSNSLNRPTQAPSNSQSASTSPSAAALAAARRRQSGISRFSRTQNAAKPAPPAAASNPTPVDPASLANNNSTIPALNPRRN